MIAFLLCAAPVAAFNFGGAKPKQQARQAPKYVKAEDMVGVSGPLGFFDPLGLSTDLEPGRLAFYKEAELKHGRVAMLAAVGFLVQEQVHFVNGPFGGIDSPSYVSFEQGWLKNGLWVGLAIGAGNLEEKSVKSFVPLDGPWLEEQNADRLFRVIPGRLTGDYGFDPLNIKPEDPEELAAVQLKEINNGRLAMFGILGMVAQELVTGAKIF
ncbi:putative plastid light harvesting protein [Pelagophyceae sp. CCMP2097]|nr:putative plastid light harvesting protein [Pelagophyceae sp. CCMP2097]